MRYFYMLLAVNIFISMLVLAEQYIFEADLSTDQLMSSYISKEDNTSVVQRIPADGDLPERIRYRVFVTKEEYEAGWETLDAKKKQAAKDAAIAELTKLANMDKLLAAVSKVFLEEINKLRLKAGLTPYTEEDINAKIKEAYLTR